MYKRQIQSYCNTVSTPDGGTHEAGFRAALIKGLKSYGELTNEKRAAIITAEDVIANAGALISVFIRNPEFQGQTKDRLNNPEVAAAVDSFIRNAVENWLNGNPSSAEAISNRVILAARARNASRAAAKEVTRKSAVSHRLNLPGKLADCSSTDPRKSELFLVEGESAGGSAKQGRDRKFQAILPLRGKVLNTETANRAKVLANAELSDIVKAMGCGLGGDYDASKLRYHKLVLLMDADSDGHHIATLLLTFFYRHMPQLIADGHLFLAVPPLYLSLIHISSPRD